MREPELQLDEALREEQPAARQVLASLRIARALEQAADRVEGLVGPLRGEAQKAQRVEVLGQAFLALRGHPSRVTFLGASPSWAFAAGANIASGARAGSGSWLAAFGTFSLDVTLVASTILTANQPVAALYFASTLSRPRRS